ncbi:MAG: DUF2971 domain-containing protein [Ramlibacter sp.]|nr:DUF2971 domain-containing protein [Ramlibacter sp.]
MANETPKQRGFLYRIMDFHRVVQVFERKELHFAHPSTWDDPYEKFIKHPRSHALFAQCWTRAYSSDAMWRIYSPHGLGVRISTTEEKLNAAGRAFATKQKFKWRSKDVDYYKLADFKTKTQELANDLKAGFTIKRAADALYMKRDAFEHEVEWRATLYCPDAREQKAGLALPVDPHDLIRNILLDPRAPQELVDAFIHYFKDKLGFKGQVKRSALYASPKPIEIADLDEL